MTSSFRNPILPGFFPDPSCVRVDDTFYLITSSFQFFPGLPIHRSRNLIDWELIGHAICRPDQLSLELATTKVNNSERKEIFTAGLYAPTIRWHKGMFYIVCTNLIGETTIGPDEDFLPHNFLIVCSDLSNPNAFSEPMHFGFHGIDPSLFFDEDGQVYLQGSFIHGYRKKPATVIRQAAFDVRRGQVIGEMIDIWTGSGDKVPEGPHIYKKDGYYWLLIAEGGTHRGHKITMARSKDVWGPFESYGNNPVLMASKESKIQCVGHGDLFNDFHGDWWCCMLARREHDSCYPLGRETFLVPVSWPRDEYPQFSPVQLEQKISNRPTMALDGPVIESVNGVTLASSQAIYLRSPHLRNYLRGDDESTIRLLCTGVPLGASSGSPSFFGVRQTSLFSKAEVIVDLATLPANTQVGLSLYKDTYRHVSINIGSATLLVSIEACYPNQTSSSLSPTPVSRANALKLTITSCIEHYSFSLCSMTDNSWSESKTLFQLPASEMSGDDFTGTIYGVYGVGKEELVDFKSFNVNNVLGTI
ncbi:beta-xylosidase [Corynespora cassiicola Philippines]|uniref:Beta-xylosidase n=1 Tax=Corynespora cassiicola Philippines TaxID=1448308 RepID=A0A2T2NZC5_CORCC|nr:beta-xylosidase [Corynespora cassiicola Philippines]